MPQFSGSVALMGAVSRPLPFGPVLAEQFANNFTGLIGGTMATTALVIRFFQKQGLKVAVAASSGVMNALAGGIVQIVLVTVGLLVTSTQFVPSSVGGGGIGRLIVIGIIVIGVAVSIALLVPKLRAADPPNGRSPGRGRTRQPAGASSRARARPSMIFGGNLCSQIAYALVLDAALHAYGASLPLADLIVINSPGVARRRHGAGAGRDGRDRGRADRRHDRGGRAAVRGGGGHLHRPAVHRLPAADLGLGGAAVAPPPRLRVAPRAQPSPPICR